MTDNDSPPVWSLPVDPTSPSSMVSATHLILFRLDELKEGARSRAPGGAIVRDLMLRVTVEEVFKGRLQAAHPTAASLTIRQEGLDPMGEGPPPTLDPNTLTPGASYLLDAVGPEEATLADVFAQGAARGVYPAEYALDARVARSAEERFAGATTSAGEVVELLLGIAESRRAELHDLFGAYLWLRVTPEMATDHENKILGRLLNVALSPDCHPGLALELLAELDTFALDLDNDAEMLARLARVYTNALGRQLSPRVTAYVATQNLYNLVFDAEGNVMGSVASFGLTPSTVANARATLGAIKAERASALIDWLR